MHLTKKKRAALQKPMFGDDAIMTQLAKSDKLKFDWAKSTYEDGYFAAPFLNGRQMAKLTVFEEWSANPSIYWDVCMLSENFAIVRYDTGKVESFLECAIEAEASYDRLLP